MHIRLQNKILSNLPSGAVLVGAKLSIRKRDNNTRNYSHGNVEVFYDYNNVKYRALISSHGAWAKR